MKIQRTASLLLVEDDDVDVMSVKRAFRKLKIANPLHITRDGLEALAALRNPGQIPRPTLVLLDLNMPRMNGLEFLEEIRKDSELKKLVVFVLTTSEADEDLCAAYQQNVAGYIVKSDVAKDFMEVIALLDHYWRVVELPQI